MAQHPRLFVSDLDHTLLQPDATLSPGARRRLTRLLDAGLPFTVASARSIFSIREILGDLPLHLPVIHYNGAFLSDYRGERHYARETIPSEVCTWLIEQAERRRLSPMISTHNGRDAWIFHGPPANAGMEWYVTERLAARDGRCRQVSRLSTATTEPVVSITLIDRCDALEPMQAAIEAAWPDHVWTHLYENQYNRPWHWLSVHPARGTKAHALRRLMDACGCEPAELTVFGDHDNDIPMFQLAGRACAVAGATPALRAVAHEIIGSNSQDAVIDQLECLWPGS